MNNEAISINASKPLEPTEEEYARAKSWLMDKHRNEETGCPIKSALREFLPEVLEYPGAKDIKANMQDSLTFCVKHGLLSKGGIEVACLFTIALTRNKLPRTVVLDAQAFLMQDAVTCIMIRSAARKIRV